MLGRLLGKCRISRTRRTVRGSVMPIFAAMSLPVLMSVGVGVDMTRLTLAKSALQGAVDGAALAAARAGGNQPDVATANTTAISVATNFFNGAAQGPSVTVSAPTVTPAPAAANYQVSVTAQGTMKTVFLGAARYIGLGTSLDIITIKAQATASNLATPGSLQAAAQPVMNSGHVSADAWDWNSAYLYAVPLKADGVTPDYATYPDPSKFYQIGNNCSSAKSTNWSSSSLCNAAASRACVLQDAITSPAPIPAVLPNQPLAIIVINMTSGIKNYGGNSFKAQPGSCQVFTSARLSLQQPPSYLADQSAGILNSINAAAILRHTIPTYVIPDGQKTKYATEAANCTLLVQVADPNNLPTTAPYTNSCYSPSDPTETQSGKQYANLSCAQMNGRTFLYWFNDMGGGGDDMDYNDLSFSITCSAPSNAGGGTGTNNSNLTVSLLK